MDNTLANVRATIGTLFLVDSSQRLRPLASMITGKGLALASVICMYAWSYLLIRGVRTRFDSLLYREECLECALRSHGGSGREQAQVCCVQWCMQKLHAVIKAVESALQLHAF